MHREVDMPDLPEKEDNEGQEDPDAVSVNPYLAMIVTNADNADPARAKKMPRRSTEVLSSSCGLVGVVALFSPVVALSSASLTSGNNADGLEMRTTPTVRMMPMMHL